MYKLTFILFAEAPFCTYKTNPKNPRQFKPKVSTLNTRTELTPTFTIVNKAY